MTFLPMLSPDLDKRILASDADRLVLAVHAPEETRGLVQYLTIGLLAAVAAATAFLLFRPYLSATAAMILFVAIVFSAIAYTLTKTVFVALRGRDEIFLETTNRITHRRHRKELGKLSAVTRYEVIGFLDTDTDVFERPLYELRLLRDTDAVPIWYCGAREIAVAAGEEIVRLARTLDN